MARKDYDDFDKFAKGYREIHNESLKFSGADSDHFSEQKVAEIKKYENSTGLNILDLGCGDGNSAVFFTQYFSGCRYSGLDTSTESIRQAESRGVEGCSFFHYDGFAIPFADELFDVVFIACVLHHVDRKRHVELLAEVKRVLKPEGRLYLFEHNPLNPLTRYVVRNCPFDEDAVLLTAGYTRKILQKAGFRKVHINYTIFFPPNNIFRGLLGLETYLRWLPLGGQYYAVSEKAAQR